jgi:hypothetical protein
MTSQENSGGPLVEDAHRNSIVTVIGQRIVGFLLLYGRTPLLFLFLFGGVGSIVAAAYVSDPYWISVMIEFGAAILLFVAIETTLEYSAKLGWRSVMCLVVTGIYLIVIAKNMSVYYQSVSIEIGAGILLFVAIDKFVEAMLTAMKRGESDFSKKLGDSPSIFRLLEELNDRPNRQFLFLLDMYNPLLSEATKRKIVCDNLYGESSDDVDLIVDQKKTNMLYSLFIRRSSFSKNYGTAVRYYNIDLFDDLFSRLQPSDAYSLIEWAVLNAAESYYAHDFDLAMDLLVGLVKRSERHDMPPALSADWDRLQETAKKLLTKNVESFSFLSDWYGRNNTGST